MILVMEWQQRNRIIKLYPHSKRKVFLFRQFYDQSVREVADPIAAPWKIFMCVFDDPAGL